MSDAGNAHRSVAAVLPAVLTERRLGDLEQLLAEDVCGLGDDGAECR